MRFDQAFEDRLLELLESMAVSLESIAAHTRGQLTMDLKTTEPILTNIDAHGSNPEMDRVVGEVPQVPLHKVTGLFDGLESPEWSAPPEPETPATREDVIAALNKVALKHGPETGKRVLGQCGVTKLAELPEDKYREVIKTCEALL